MRVAIVLFICRYALAFAARLLFTVCAFQSHQSSGEPNFHALGHIPLMHALRPTSYACI